MIVGKRYNGTNVDLWSCGVILFAMVCGYLPFEDPNTSALYKKILSANYTIPKFISSEGRDIITKILNTDPEKRFKIADIRRHPWYCQVKLRDYDGIVVGTDPIPIDPTIVSQLDQYGFNLDYAKKCIASNRHNHVAGSDPGQVWSQIESRDT